MVSPERVREIALALPEAFEADHHGRPSYRVAGRIFATQADPQTLNVMVDRSEVLAATQEDPECCQPLFWGKQLRGVKVDLVVASSDVVEDLLGEAWAQQAPPALLGGLKGRPHEGGG